MDGLQQRENEPGNGTITVKWLRDLVAKPVQLEYRGELHHSIRTKTFLLNKKQHLNHQISFSRGITKFEPKIVSFQP